MKDEHFYEIAAEEVRRSGPITGLLAKAFAETDGDKQKAEALYLRLRVDQLKKLVELSQMELQQQRLMEREADIARMASERKAQGYVAGIPPNGVAALVIIGGILFLALVVVLISQ